MSNSSCMDQFSSGGEEDDNMNIAMDDDLRRGPWTVEEDFALINYIAHHGEGRWNSLARCAGLKRTGKSCRLRWLNYLRPDVRRGNITLEEQLLILELHSRWGNRWSKIAQHLPGRTDNEIKNYWRTRVQKHAKQLKCDVNSKQFKDTMRYLWMPRLVERIQAASAATTITENPSTTTNAATTYPLDQDLMDINPNTNQNQNQNQSQNQFLSATTGYPCNYVNNQINSTYTPDQSRQTAVVSPSSDLTDYYYPITQTQNQECQLIEASNPMNEGFYGPLISPSGYFHREMGFEAMEENSQWSSGNGGDFSDTLWNVDDILFLQQFNSM